MIASEDEIRDKIFYESEVTYEPTTMKNPHPEQVVKINLNQLMGLIKDYSATQKKNLLADLESKLGEPKNLRDIAYEDGNGIAVTQAQGYNSAHSKFISILNTYKGEE